MANNIMVVVVINLMVVVALAVFSILFIQKGAGMRFDNNNPAFDIVEKGQARILSMRQTRVFINNNPVFSFTLEISAKGRTFILSDHRETVLYIAIASYKENSVYSVLLGESKQDVVFEKNRSGSPVLIDAKT